MVVAIVAVLIAFVLVGRPLVSSALDRREKLVSTNTKVGVSATATVLRRGDRVCAAGIYLPKDATRLRVFPGTDAPGTPRLQVALRLAKDGPLALRRTVRVTTPGQPLDVDLGTLRADAADVCFRNVGKIPVSIANREDTGDTFQGRPGIPRVDALAAGDPRTLALLPDAIERAGLFKGGLVAPGVIVVLLLLAVGVFGLAVAAAVRDLGHDDADSEEQS